MITVQLDQNPFFFSYDSSQSTLEGRSVTNVCAPGGVNSLSILCPSGTGGLQVWANNSTPYIIYNSRADNTFFYPSGPATNDNFGSLTTSNLPNPSFSSNWVNITNSPVISISSSGFFGSDIAVKFLRLQGAGATGTMLGYIWSNDMIAII